MYDTPFDAHMNDLLNASKSNVDLWGGITAARILPQGPPSEPITAPAHVPRIWSVHQKVWSPGSF